MQTYIWASLAGCGTPAPVNTPALALDDGAVEASTFAPELLVYEPLLPTTLHPLFPKHAVDRRTSALVFDRLFHRSTLTDRVESRVFSEWEVTDAGLRVTVRDGLQFHDGHAADAEDVCFSVQAVLDPATASSLPFHTLNRPLGCTVASSETAVLQFDHTPPNPWDHAEVPLLPAHLFGSTALAANDRFSANPIGTGPFKARRGREFVELVAVDPDARIPSIGLASGDPLVASRAFQTSGGAVAVSAAYKSEVSATHDVRTAPYDRRSMLYLAANSRTLGDPNMRYAIDGAVDRTRLLELTAGSPTKTLGEAPLVLTGPFLPSSPYYHPNVRPHRPNADATGPLRVGVDASVVHLYADLHHQLAGMLTEAGFEVSLDLATHPEQERHDLWLGRFHFDGSADPSSLVVQGTFGGVSDSARELVEQLRVASSPEEQRRIAQQLHAQTYDDAWLMPLWSETTESFWHASIRKNRVSRGSFWSDVDRWSIGVP